jgi:hypothetical protein
VNASASALIPDDDVQSKIRKIQTFGRNARFVCAVLFGFGLFAALMLILATTFGSRSNSADGGVYDILTSVRTPLPFKAWMFLLMAAVIGIWVAVLYQLYRLFGNLAAGAIYTPENVRRVRHVGLVLLLFPVVSIVASATLIVAKRLLGATGPSDLDRLFPSFSQLLISCLAAGLVLLVSWIMDVGRYEKEQADTLRRDADLVI